MPKYFFHSAQAESWLALIELLESAAMETAKELHKSYRKRHRIRRGSVLRPGIDTPLWNELARIAERQVGLKYGDKAKLARILGVPRQRLHDYLVAKTSLPDTERVLRLIAWLTARQAGRDP